MAKCGICGQTISWLDKKVRTRDGYICINCLRKLNYDEWNANDLSAVEQLTSEQVKEFAAKKEADIKRMKELKPTYSVGSWALFDDDSREMMLLSNTSKVKTKVTDYSLFSYDQLVAYEVIEDGSSLASGGVGRAAVGGMLFGNTGAVVGAVTRGQKVVCNNLIIKVTLDNYTKPAVYINLLNTETKKTGIIYQTTIKCARDITSKFQLIIEEKNKKSESLSVLNSSFSPADEIRKYKGLLDDGIITQAEFDKKKHELLNL